MVIQHDWFKKRIHAVSTCSPDCPTDSAVESALVDLEWRREAASKRNGNTHRINTQEPETENATVRRGCTWLIPIGVFNSKRKWCHVWMHNGYSASPPSPVASLLPPTTINTMRDTRIVRRSLQRKAQRAPVTLPPTTGLERSHDKRVERWTPGQDLDALHLNPNVEARWMIRDCACKCISPHRISWTAWRTSRHKSIRSHTGKSANKCATQPGYTSLFWYRHLSITTTKDILL